MRRNFIDRPRLDGAITLQLSLAPSPIHPHLEILARLLNRFLPEMPLGERALPEPEDPEWAHDKAEQEVLLFKLGPEGEIEARKMIAEFLIYYENLIQIAGDRTHPYRERARRHLRGAAHWKPEQDDHNPVPRLSEYLGLERFLSQAHQTKLRARGSRPFTRPATVTTEKLIGTRAITCAEIISIGREARNCLSRKWAAKDKVKKGHDIWALRAEGQIVVVIEVDDSGTICELRGPKNACSIGGYGAELITWCQKAGLKVRDDVTVPLADFLPATLCVSTEIEEEEAMLRLMLGQAA